MKTKIDHIASLLGDEAESLLRHTCKTIPKEQLHLPGPDWVDQGREHSAGASFAPNPIENIVRLSIDSGSDAGAFTLGVQGSVARQPKLIFEQFVTTPFSDTSSKIKKRLIQYD